jgi:hypothetical protein
MKYCKVIDAKIEEVITGGERWVLTHECGKVEKRTARKRGSRHTKPAPKRVKCK